MKTTNRCATCRWSTRTNSPQGEQCQNPEECENANHDGRPIATVYPDDPACRDYSPSDDEIRRTNARNARRRASRRAYADAMASCGLVRVRSDSGRIYWE